MTNMHINMIFEGHVISKASCRTCIFVEHENEVMLKKLGVTWESTTAHTTHYFQYEIRKPKI